MKKKKKIVVIGGGTGTYVALSGLKKFPFKLSAIVTMMDSGGSTGRLRDKLGVLPPGDIRQALVALSDSDEIWRKLFTYRFSNGELRGHNFGNLFLSALEKITGRLDKAIKQAGKILKVKGKIIPVTFEQADLCVELKNGRIIEGETHIDEPLEDKRASIKKAFLRPKAAVNPQALKTISSADLILIGPGDLYTSLLVNLLVRGVPDAIRESRAQVVYVLNLMTKFGQTTNYTAQDHVKALEKYLGKKRLEAVIVNTKKPGKKALKWYQGHQEKPVIDDLPEKTSFKVFRSDLLSDIEIQQQDQDKVKRSFIRHDQKKLAQAVMSLL